MAYDLNFDIFACLLLPLALLTEHYLWQVSISKTLVVSQRTLPWHATGISHLFTLYRAHWFTEDRKMCVCVWTIARYIKRCPPLIWLETPASRTRRLPNHQTFITFVGYKDGETFLVNFHCVTRIKKYSFQRQNETKLESYIYMYFKLRLAVGRISRANLYHF